MPVFAEFARVVADAIDFPMDGQLCQQEESFRIVDCPPPFPYDSALKSSGVLLPIAPIPIPVEQIPTPIEQIQTPDESVDNATISGRIIHHGDPFGLRDD